MSRVSRAHLKGRESVFTSGLEQYRGEIQAICPPNLEECVLAMQDCCEEAHEAQVLLRGGTHDFPRIKKVMESQKVFLLVDDSTVKQYKADLTDEVEPAINELIERADQGLKNLYKKESVLQAKVEAARSKPHQRPTAGTTTATNKLELRRLQMLSRQRERLEDELRTLEAEMNSLEPKTRDR